MSEKAEFFATTPPPHSEAAFLRPQITGVGIGRKIEWVSEPSLPSGKKSLSEMMKKTLEIVEDGLESIGSRTQEEAEMHQTRLEEVKNHAISQIREGKAGRWFQNYRIKKIEKRFNQIILKISEKKEILAGKKAILEKGKASKIVINIMERLKAISATIPHEDSEELSREGTALAETIADNDTPITYDFQKKISEFENKVVDLERSLLIGPCGTTRARLKALSATVPIEMKARFEALQSRGLALTPPSHEELKNPETMAGFQRDLAKFMTDVEKLEQEVIHSLQADLNVSPDVAKQIFEAGKTNWKSLITRDVDGKIKQNHNIPHLKIYEAPGFGLVADFGMEDVGSGTYKRAKAVQRIGGQVYVRLTARTKEAKPAFETDIHTEADARVVLDGIPNIAGMTKIEYLNTKGELKTRYIMTKYEGDLWDLVLTSGTKQSCEKALQCCKGVFSAVSAIHKAGRVHGDLKLANILFHGDEGFVSDFGFLSEKGKEWTCTGTLIYMSPETFFNPSSATYTTQMDMFSLGILLLAIVDRNRYVLWHQEMLQLKASFKERENLLDTMSLEIEQKKEKLTANRESLSSDQFAEEQAALQAKIAAYQLQEAAFYADYEKEYKKLHSLLQQDLLAAMPPPQGIPPQRADSLPGLIHDLINYDPLGRPDCTVAEERFTQLFW